MLSAAVSEEEVFCKIWLSLWVRMRPLQIVLQHFHPKSDKQNQLTQTKITRKYKRSPYKCYQTNP